MSLNEYLFYGYSVQVSLISTAANQRRAYKGSNYALHEIFKLFSCLSNISLIEPLLQNNSLGSISL